MHEFNEFLRSSDIKPIKYKKINNAYIINDKYVLKKVNDNKEIFNLLKSRDFKYYPKVISNNNNYELTEYINEIDIPLENKIQDLINIVSLLHNKTAFYDEMNTSEIENLYNDINNNIIHLDSYYDDLMTTIESHVFMSPWEYTLAKNISLIKYSLNVSKDCLDKWHSILEENNKIRKVVINNNLDIKNFLNSYLINWEKAKIDIPIFDIYKMYNRINKHISFENLLSQYEKNFKLHDYENYLLYSLCTLPDKLTFNDTLYNNTKSITNMVNKIKNVNDYLIKSKEKA